MQDTSKLFIPDKLKVGFQNRGGTYTGKLAYVIYIDKKGVLRKEASWQSWRDNAINPLDIDNEPTEGFVLNKGVGGNKGSYGWDTRNEYIRVYDPRDFEFEISVANLLFILRECDCSMGKGLEGKFVYSWEGTQLVLLPVESIDFKQSKNYMNLQECKITKQEMIPGKTFLTKKEEELIYVGWYDYHELTRKGKKYIFWDGKGLIHRELKNIAKVVSDEIAPNLAELIKKYYESPNGSKIIKLFLKDRKDVHHYYPALEEADGSFSQYQRNYRNSYFGYRPYLDAAGYESVYNLSFNENKVSQTKNKYTVKTEPKQYLYVLLENGIERPVTGINIR